MNLFRFLRAYYWSALVWCVRETGVALQKVACSVRSSAAGAGSSLSTTVTRTSSMDSPSLK